MKLLFSTVLVWLCSAIATADARAQADAPHSVAVDSRGPAAQWVPQVLPAGARLLHGPVELAFGAHSSGQFLAWRTEQGGYAFVYLTPESEATPGQMPRMRWLWLREPLQADFGTDVEVRAVFSAGPARSRDIVVLARYSRPLPAGGQSEDSGSVYRRVGEGVQRVPALSALLHDVRDAATARRRLAPEYARLLPVVPGKLAALFASLPWPMVELTALERLQQLRPDHPMFKAYDSANGYLELRGDAGLPGYQAALFKANGGGWMLALQKRWPQSQRTWFVRPDDIAPEGWRDVSAQVMPGFDASHDYALPQRGRVVTLAGQGSWQWNGERFEPKAGRR